MGRKKFATFWAIVLVIAIVWFLDEIGMIHFNVPWLPLIIIVVALGALINKWNR